MSIEPFSNRATDNSPSVCFRITYYEHEKDHVIAELIEPVYSDLLQRHPGCALLLQRDWRRGPGISVFVEFAGSDPAPEDWIAQTADRMRLYVKAHPSSRVIADDEARACHDIMVKYEARPEKFSALLPDNTVDVSWSHASFSHLPNEHSEGLAKRVAQRSVPLILSFARIGNGSRDIRFQLAFFVCVVYASETAGLPRGYFFARTYWEKAAAALPADYVDVADRFESRYRASSDQLRRWLLAFIGDEAYAKHSAQAMLLLAWRSLVGDTRRQAAKLLDSGFELTSGNDIALDVYGRVGWDAAALINRSPFLQTFFANKDLQRKIFMDAEMKTHVFAVNQLYNLLANFGFTSTEKMLLLYFFARAVEDHFQLDPAALLKTGSASIAPVSQTN